MTRFRLSPAAVQDLSEIWDDTERLWEVRQAEAYIGEIREAVERIAERPDRGRPCDEIRSRYRRYVVDSHVIFFRPSNAGVDVIRILHQRMDPTRHL